MKYKVKWSPYDFFNFIVMTIVSISVLISVFWINSHIYLNNGDAAKTFYSNKKPTIVVSESMEPTIMTNAIIIVEKTPFSEIKIGDIVLAETKEHGMVVHRVIEDNMGSIYEEDINGNITEVYDRYLVTKGDNNEKRDDWVVIEKIYQGKVIEIHNEFNDIITFYFRDITKASAFELLFGLLLMALTLSGIIVIIVWVYDFTFIPYFLRREVRKKDNAGEVKEVYYSWIRDRVIEKDTLVILNEISKQRNIVDRVRFNFRLMMWHNAMKAEAKKAMVSRSRFEKLKGVFKDGESYRNIDKKP